MKYTIIEDCSPYYIRFTHEGLDNVIAKCLEYAKGVSFNKGFTHYIYPTWQAKDIMDSVPLNKELTLSQWRVSLFTTQPGIYYRAHKDGMDHHYSLNYTVKILDQDCVTSWYKDEDLKDYPIDLVPNKDNKPTSRECIGFDKSKHTPIKSMTAIQGECILFNTELFHDFDNSKSKNERMVLTLRDFNPGAVYFEDAREKLFGGIAQLGEQ